MAIFTNNFREFKREAHELIDQVERTGSASNVSTGLDALLEIHNVRINRLRFRMMVEKLCLAHNCGRARQLIDVLDDDALKDWAVYAIRVVVITLLGSGALGLCVGVVYFALWLSN